MKARRCLTFTLVLLTFTAMLAADVKGEIQIRKGKTSFVFKYERGGTTYASGTVSDGSLGPTAFVDHEGNANFSAVGEPSVTAYMTDLSQLPKPTTKVNFVVPVSKTVLADGDVNVTYRAYLMSEYTASYVVNVVVSPYFTVIEDGVEYEKLWSLKDTRWDWSTGPFASRAVTTTGYLNEYLSVFGAAAGNTSIKASLEVTVVPTTFTTYTTAEGFRYISAFGGAIDTNKTEVVTESGNFSATSEYAPARDDLSTYIEDTVDPNGVATPPVLRTGVNVNSPNWFYAGLSGDVWSSLLALENLQNYTTTSENTTLASGEVRVSEFRTTNQTTSSVLTQSTDFLDAKAVRSYTLDVAVVPEIVLESATARWRPTNNEVRLYNGFVDTNTWYVGDFAKGYYDRVFLDAIGETITLGGGLTYRVPTLFDAVETFTYPHAVHSSETSSLIGVRTKYINGLEYEKSVVFPEEFANKTLTDFLPGNGTLGNWSLSVFGRLITTGITDFYSGYEDLEPEVDDGTEEGPSVDVTTVVVIVAVAAAGTVVFLLVRRRRSET